MKRIEVLLAIFALFLGMAAGFWAGAIRMDINRTMAILFSCFAGLLFIVLIRIYLREGKWLGRETWIARSSYGNNEQDALTKRGWRSPMPQSAQQNFMVDFGKERELISIRLESDQSHLETPKHWQIELFGDDPNVCVDTINDHNSEPIEVKNLNKRVRQFVVWIKEPHEDVSSGSNYDLMYHSVKPRWFISNIRIKEYKYVVFGRKFGEREI